MILWMIIDWFCCCMLLCWEIVRLLRSLLIVFMVSLKVLFVVSFLGIMGGVCVFLCLSLLFWLMRCCCVFCVLSLIFRIVYIFLFLFLRWWCGLCLIISGIVVWLSVVVMWFVLCWWVLVMSWRWCCLVSLMSFLVSWKCLIFVKCRLFGCVWCGVLKYKRLLIFLGFWSVWLNVIGVLCVVGWWCGLVLKSWVFCCSISLYVDVFLNVIWWFGGVFVEMWWF